jgi:hypothetical protein
VVLDLAAQRDNGDDIGLRALEKLATIFSTTHALKLAQATRIELTKAHAWIAATQAERAKAASAAVTRIDVASAPDQRKEIEESLQAQHASVDDVPLASESVARQLERIGDKGRELATVLRDGCRRRMREYRTGNTEACHVFAAWVPRDTGEAPTIMAIAEALWHDRIKRTRKMQVNSHCKMPKHVGGIIPWAAGAPAVELDGSQFRLTANAPTKIFGPRSLALLPDGLDLNRAHTAILPLDFEHDANPEAQLALAMVNPVQVALNTAGSKIALLALGDPHVLSGGIATASAKEWASRIHTGQRYQGYMLKTAAEGLTSLRSIMLYLPDGTRVQMFSIRDVVDPKAVKPDMEFAVALDRQFQEVVWQAFRGRGTTWCGSFLLDVTGAMALPMNRPELLRLHVRASVVANSAFSYKTAAFDPTKLKFESLTEIAARINSIDAHAAELLTANGKLPRSSGWTAVKTSEQRRKIRENMEQLEGRGLWTVDKQGRDRFRLLPTEKYLDAWSGIRRHGQQR